MNMVHIALAKSFEELFAKRSNNGTQLRFADRQIVQSVVCCDEVREHCSYTKIKLRRIER